MSTLKEIFEKRNISLFQNESLDLDHYYPEPYQDDGDEIKDMGESFETDKTTKKRKIEIMPFDSNFSNFSFFMDGSRRTYKIGDVILEGKKIYPVIIAQVRAACTQRNEYKKIQTFSEVSKKNLLLLSDKMNDVDFAEIRQRILKTETAKLLSLDVVEYHFEPSKDNIPVNAAIAKANSIMHDLEVTQIDYMVNKTNALNTNKMLIIDGPIQFLKQDTGKPEFADLFYNVIGVSKSFDPMLPTSNKNKRGYTQIGAELLRLNYGERTPVFLKENSKHRKFGFWYLRIRPRNRVENPLEGIIKIEKMATLDDSDGLNSSIVDNISLSLLNEGNPTCFGKDVRWASHLYPIYLTETLVKSTFESDWVFIHNFRRDFR